MKYGPILLLATLANKKSNKGFSIVEVVVSAGAFAVFAILIQNVLLLAHSFQVSQKNVLDMFQINHMIKQKVCMANSHFKYENIEWKDSYQKIPPREEQSDGEADPSAPVAPPIWISYNKLGDDNSDTPTPLIFLENESGSPHGVKQDSHTLVVLNSNSSTLSLERNDTTKSADFLSGYIFASRCVEVGADDVLQTSNGGHKATFDLDNIEEAAKEILDSRFRPAYFPKAEANKDKMRCCEDLENCSKSAIGDYAPRIYVIHLTKSEEGIANEQTMFAGKVTAIQELPEVQDMDTMWGSGFMLSMKKKQRLSGVAFSLDIMTLKNTCSTSLGHVKNCASLSLNQNPYDQKLIGLEGSNMNMGKFITTDISSCSGFSYGVDTGSAIMF